MLRIFLISLLISLLALVSSPALAVYKCESGGATSYSETPCPGGKAIDVSDRAAPAAAAQAQLQAARDKKELARLENARHKREAIEEKEQQRQARAYAARQKKCLSLAQRSKWATEDAAKAVGKSAAKLKLKAHRLDEKYALECGK